MRSKKLPKINIIGQDISSYALKNSKKEVRKYLYKHSAQKKQIIELNTLI